LGEWGREARLDAVNYVPIKVLLVFVLGSLLAFDGQLVIDEREVYVFFIDAWQLGAERHVLFVLGDVDRGASTPPILRPNQSSKRESTCVLKPRK
jgi:hypothetical protein